MLQRDVVFHMDKEAIKQIAIDGTNMVKERMKNCEGNITLEYSPESFTGTEMEFALDICTRGTERHGTTRMTTRSSSICRQRLK